MRRLFAATLIGLSATSAASAGPFAPAAGHDGSTAIPYTSPLFVEWASGVADLTRGPVDIARPGLGLASYGSPSNALGPAKGTTTDVVSLGDGGSITLTFDKAIRNGAGADFAVFENGFTDSFLELGFVEVSSDGTHFFRFPSISLTQTTTQVGPFGTLDPTNLYDLAGKYRVGYGTPFDLQELAGVSPALNVDDVRYVRVVDVIGTIDPLYASHDSQGHIVNDPYSTPFASGGFDLGGVGVLNVVPEPASLVLVVIGLAVVCGRVVGGQRRVVGGQ